MQLKLCEFPLQTYLAVMCGVCRMSWWVCCAFLRGFVVVLSDLLRDDVCLFFCELSKLRSRSGRWQSVLNTPSGGRDRTQSDTDIVQLVYYQNQGQQHIKHDAVLDILYPK